MIELEFLILIILLSVVALFSIFLSIFIFVRRYYPGSIGIVLLDDNAAFSERECEELSNDFKKRD